MRLFKSGDRIVWHDLNACALKGIVIEDQKSASTPVKTEWFFPNCVIYKTEYAHKLIRLEAPAPKPKSIKKLQHVWVVESFTWNKWVPLAASPTRAVARRMKSANEYKTRIRKYYA